MTDVQLTPYLSPHDCAAAIAFYEKAFGAVETGARFTDPEGRIGHSEISIGGATLYLSDVLSARHTNIPSHRTMGNVAHQPGAARDGLVNRVTLPDDRAKAAASCARRNVRVSGETR